MNVAFASSEVFPRRYHRNKGNVQKQWRWASYGVLPNAEPGCAALSKMHFFFSCADSRKLCCHRLSLLVWDLVQTMMNQWGHQLGSLVLQLHFPYLLWQLHVFWCSKKSSHLQSCCVFHKMFLTHLGQKPKMWNHVCHFKWALKCCQFLLFALVLICEALAFRSIFHVFTQLSQFSMTIASLNEQTKELDCASFSQTVCFACAETSHPAIGKEQPLGRRMDQSAPVVVCSLSNPRSVPFFCSEL